MKTCKDCKHFKKHDDKHATCESNHMMIRSARLPIKYFTTFSCSAMVEKLTKPKSARKSHSLPAKETNENR